MDPTSAFVLASPHDAAARLCALLPGLAEAAAARFVARQHQMRALFARAGRSPPPLRGAPSPLDVFDLDGAWQHAQALGWRIDARRVDMNREAAALAHELLLEIAAVPGDIFVVDHDTRTYRGPAAGLLEFAVRPLDRTGDVSFNGLDELFIAADVPRVVMVHHEGWAFDLQAP